MSIRIVCSLGVMLALTALSTAGAQDPFHPQAGAQTPDTARRIHTPYFSVVIPGDWKVSVAEDSTAIRAERAASGFPGLVANQVGTMAVGMLTVAGGAPTDPAAVAAAYFDGEEARVQAFQNRFPKDVSAGTERKPKSIGRYALQYFGVEMIRWSGLQRRYEEHYLYFPPDFGSRQEYFLFVIVKEYDAPEGMHGVKEIQGVIRSFQDERLTVVSGR